MRDRKIVINGLYNEVGQLLHPFELELTTQRSMLIPFWNYFSLRKSSQGYRKARRKQLDLVELAFLKQRYYRGERDLERRDYELRSRIMQANQAGVFIGNPYR